MKAKIIFPGFVLCLFCNLMVTSQSASEWKEFSSPEGKFSILFPGTPTTGYRPAGADSDTSVTYVTNFQREEKAWTVAYFDLPTVPSDEQSIKKLFDQTRDRMLKMYSSRLASEEDMILMNYPVRAFRTKPDDRNRVFYTRICLVRQRLYQVWALTGRDKEKSDDVVRYFDSFRPVPMTDEEIKNLKSFFKAENEKAVPRKIPVSGGVLQQQATRKVQPVYPSEARKAGITGQVQVRVLVSEQGDVIEAQAISGPAELRDAAVQAVQQWKFNPVRLSGSPIKMEGVLNFVFSAR